MLLIACSTYGQSYLVLYKSGTDKKYVYPEGQPVHMTLNGEKEPSYFKLDQVEAAYFISGMDTVRFSEVEQIYLPNPKGPARAVLLLGKVLFVAGFGMIILDLANQVVIDEPYSANTELWALGGVAGTAGILPYIIKRKKRKIRGRWKLQKRHTAL